MSLLVVKLLRDLRASWPRFVLMVVALAVSLTVFASMLFAWAAAGRETRDAYLSTEPASATIVLDEGLDPAAMADIVEQARRQPGVLDATGRTQFDGRVEVAGRPLDVTLQTFVAAPDDPMRMVKFDLRRDGGWPAAPGEIWLSGDGTLDLLGVDVGDTVTVTTPTGDRLPLRIAGTVYDPSLAPSPQEQRGHAYLSTESAAAAGLLNQLKIRVADPGGSESTRDRARAVSVATRLAGWLRDEHGLTVEEVQAPKPYAHPHQWQADVLLLSLLAGGAAALLLAGILVATMLDNLFTQQIPQIGIMKATGARSVHIGRLYVAMVGLVAAAATLLALYPAILVSTNLVEGLVGMLGITPGSLAAPGWTYLVVVAAGLGLPVLLALPPLVRASRTTVRAAIDHHGGAREPSRASAMLTRLGRLRLDRGLLMALRNTVRRPARFWLSVGLLAAAGTVFVAGMSLRSGTEAKDENAKAQRYWDVEVQLAQPARAPAATQAARQVPDVARVEAWTRVPVGVASGSTPVAVTDTYPDQGHGSVSLDTVPAAKAQPSIVDGRWLTPGETGAVVLAADVRDRSVPDLGPGDPVRLFIEGKPTTWRIAGIVDQADSGGVYTTAEGLAKATGTAPYQVNRLRLITGRHDEHTRQTVATDAKSTLTGAGIDVEQSASVSRQDAAGSGHLGPVLLVLIGVALPLGVLGAIALATTMSANVLDRIREFGVLHAIGARPRTVRRIVIAEGVILAATSCLVAALPTLGLTALLGWGLGETFGNLALPFTISPLGVGLWLLVVLLGAALATDAAATRASRITVREALTYL